MRASPAPGADPGSRRAWAAARALLPALFLALLTFWGGTFSGGATFAGAASGHAGLLAFGLLGAARWRDPLGLGRRGRWLVPALLLATLASWLSGPVPRAGVVGLVLLPAYLLMPMAVAACWSRPRERRLGLGALGLLLAAVTALVVVRWLVEGGRAATTPLGNENLLAVWLVILWPVGLVSFAGRRLGRPAAVLVGSLALIALAATGSFLAGFAIVVQLLLAAVWWKRARAWLAAVALVVCIGPEITRLGSAWLVKGRPAAESVAPARATGPLQRAAGVLSGTDRSLMRRAVYARAGWTGLRQRPLLGWGPASAPWTFGQFVEPVAGVNRPSEVVGDLHSWPLQLGYETGVVGLGLVAAIGWLFARRRLRELAAASDRSLLRAALLGLVGGVVMLTGNAAVAVVALPAALAVVAGAALASTARPAGGSGPAALGLGCLYLLPAVLVLLPLERAHLSYQRALRAETPIAALAQVRRAHELDPDFPLYRARAAWLAAELGWPAAAVAEEARRAAAGARHLAPLWLAAGVLGLEAGRPWAEDAIDRARRLDPHSPLAAFHQLRASPGREDAAELAAEALRGDRRLARAVFWDQHPELHRAVLERLGHRVPARGASRALLVQRMDSSSNQAFSLFAFRRSPWPADIAPIEVYR